MTKLTETQSLILSRAAVRPGNLALPLPAGLHGAAASKVVTLMISRGWLREAAASPRRGEPLWRETGDGQGVTLVATDTGLAAIGVDTAGAPPTDEGARAVVPRAGTKQAQIIVMLQRPEGATIAEIVEATGWLAHTARGALSGSLRKKLGLTITSGKIDGRGTVYRIDGDRAVSR
jgi:hypothetical protein